MRARPARFQVHWEERYHKQLRSRCEPNTNRRRLGIFTDDAAGVGQLDAMQKMRCLYETLGVSRDASEDEIRKAYRKQALKWHPDKNQDNLEHAEEQFKAVQNAYEVLNDPQERSWYDRHREQILRSGERHQAGGGVGWEPGQKPEDEIDLFQFFTSSCYQGVGDGPKGFYAVYGNLFAELAKQEMAAWEAQLEHEDEPEPGPFPRFGDSQLGTAELQAFYTFWLNFVTVKDFSWADMYNPASAPDRRVRRKMQEENKKSRRAVRQEFVDTVRELTAFVRKRDKRYQALQQQEKLRREASQKAEQERRKAERRERVAAAAAKADADWITVSEAQAWEEPGMEAVAGSEEEHMQCFLCAVCDKVFKSEKQLANHEKSKKHKEQLRALRKLLEEEEEAAEALQQGASGAGEGTGRDSGGEEAEERQRGAREPVGSAGGEEGGAADGQGGSEARRRRKKKKKKLPRGFRDSDDDWQPGDGSEEGSGGTERDDAAGTDGERELIERMAGMGAAGARGDDADGSGGESGGDAGEEHAPLPEAAVEPAVAGPVDEAQPEAAGGGRQGLSHQELKRQKRREKQARQAAASSGGRSVESAGLRCTVCRVLFPSRNKLFQHIKDTGHAALKRN